MNKKGYLKWTYLLLIIFLTSGLLFCFLKKEMKEKSNLEIVESKENGNETKNNHEAYDFSLLDREGNEIKLSHLKGKVIFINFWNMECKLCRKEMAHIQEIYDTYKDKEVVVLAVNVLTDKEVDQERVNKFLESQEYTFPVVYDIDGKVFTRYKVKEFPTTYIIDKEGEIAEYISGNIEKKTIVEKIENVLNQ